jgi:low temperature requirement protein LtrA
MRVPMVFQWLRVGRQDPARREVCRVMIGTLVTAQVGWVLLAVADLTTVAMFAGAAVLVLIEVAGPVVAESLRDGTPWHGHHIAERYGLMVIIALGEGLLGTTAALGALVEEGWTVEVVVLGVAGTAMIFGVWWSYFVIPHGHLLSAHRDRSFAWGYGHIPLFGAVVAIGAGLHVAAYFLEEHSALGSVGTILAVAVPMAAYLACLYLLYAQISHTIDPFHVLLVAISVALLALAVALAAADVPMVWCLAVVAVVPWVTVVGYETVGHRHNAEVLAGLEG